MFEKKRGKRFLASVMALVMLLSLAPVGALAADGTTTEESPAVAQSAVEGKDQQAVVDTGDTNENTPTEPAKDSDSAEATKPEGDLDESYSNVDADTSNNDNGIAVQNFDDDRAAKEDTITAEYWVTNSKVSVSGSNSMDISQNYPGMTNDDGVSVESLAPETGTQGGNTAIFWQARVLPYGNHQTDGGGVNQTSKGTEIQRIKYNSSSKKFQYQAKDSTTWNDINTWTYWKDQLVFYYLIKTNFVAGIQINVSDWPASDAKGYESSFRKVTYRVYEVDDNGEVISN